MENKIILPSKIQIYYESFGLPKNPAVVLNMGNSCDGVMWPDTLCQDLADHGLFVIRFDQRDTGLSTWIDFSKEPYTLIDMAADILGLMDELEIQKAHIVGYSTGGLIAQLMGVHFPHRVQSLILLMTSTDLTIKNDAFRGLDVENAQLPPPKKEYIQAILALHAKPQETQSEKISFLLESFRLSNGTKSVFDAAFFSRVFERSLKRVDARLNNVGHKSNHALATSATPPITDAEFKKISVPTLILSGSEDPIFPPPHGESLLNAIPGSHLEMINGMGHVLNPPFLPQIAESILKHIKLAELEGSTTLKPGRA